LHFIYSLWGEGSSPSVNTPLCKYSAIVISSWRVYLSYVPFFSMSIDCDIFSHMGILKLSLDRCMFSSIWCTGYSLELVKQFIFCHFHIVLNLSPWKINVYSLNNSLRNMLVQISTLMHQTISKKNICLTIL